MSDSSSFSDTSKQNESDESTKERKLQRENAKLISKNFELTNQLTNLRNQFDQALDVSTKIDNIYSANSEYSKEISKLKAEKDDLNRRLQIALQNNQDLNNKLQNYANNCANYGLNENNDFFKHQKEQYESYINDLKKKCETLTKSYEDTKQISDQTRIIMDSVYQAAGHHFGQLIDSPHSLLECFIHNSSNCSPDTNVQKLTKLVSKLTKKLKKKQMTIDDFERKINKLNMPGNNSIKINDNSNYQITELNAQNNELKERTQFLTQQMDELSRKNASLIEELAAKNSQLKLNIFQNEDKQAQENQQLTSQLTSARTQLDTFAKKNKLLKNKLFIIVCKAKSLEKKCKQYESVVKSLETKKEDLKNEIQKNLSLNTQCEFKVKDIETAVLRAQDELNMQKKENDKLRDEMSKYVEKLKQSEREYKELRGERDQLISQSQQFDGKIKTYENKLVLAEKNIESLEKQLKDAQNPLDAANLIPPSVLNSPDFPGDLQTMLGEVARNTALNLTVRIQSTFSTIAKWYKNNFEGLEKTINEKQFQYNALKTHCDSLIDFLRRLMPEVKINFDLILSDEHTRNFLGDAIRNLKENQRTQPLIDGICSLLGIQKLDFAKEAIEELHSVISDLQKEVRKQKDSKKKVIMISKEREEELEGTFQSLETNYKGLEAKFKEQEEQKNELQNQIFGLQKQNKAQIEEIEKSYEEKISSINKEYFDLQKQFENVKALKESVSKLTKRKDRLEEEIQQRQKQSEEAEKKYKQRIKGEKEKYDQMMEQSRKQTSELQIRIRELTDKYVKIEATNQVLTSNNNEMSLKIQKLETRTAAIQSEAERDKKSLESQFTAKLMFSETEYKSKIEEKQMQVDMLKKKMVDAISRAFTSYLDGMRVDENNFEGALQVLRKKVDTITVREANMRNMLKLDPRQSLEEVISALASKRRRR